MSKVLLIEDNADLRETTKEILELAGYAVVAAENGRKGVDLVRAEKPDIVVCDIMMPDLDGYGVLRILGKNPETSNIPFIFLTAKSDVGDMRMGMNLGADDYITKPFDDSDLLGAIEMRLKRSEGLRRSYERDLEGLNQFMNEARGLKDLENLSKDRKIKFYGKKDTIYREDDFANYLYLITKGKVKCMKTDSYGKDFVHELHNAGEFIGYNGLFEDGEYEETAIALEPTEVAVIPKEDFRALVNKNRDVAMSFIKLLSGNVKDKERRLLQLAYAPVSERLAETLVQLFEKGTHSNGTPDRFSISREDLASMVGTAKESLIRALSEFKKDGYVNTDGQEIEILNKAALRAIAHRS
jgi:CRP-like cAMP-binding protein